METKNGAVIRKHMGYDHIASEHAEAINAFYEEHFNPYLNFHRPCAVPEAKKDSRGKRCAFIAGMPRRGRSCGKLPASADA